MVQYVKNDLEFILAQIKISEQHATTLVDGVITAGTPLTDLIFDPHLPWGMRTVDGSYNNLLAGREDFGAADQLFPRLLDPTFQTADDNPRIPGTQITSYAQNSGDVYDAQPRLISNLIVDQTINNPAAVAAIFADLGATNPWGEAQSFIAAYDAVVAAQAAVDGAGGDIAAAAAALADAQAAATAANAAAQAAADALAALLAGDPTDQQIADALAASDTAAATAATSAAAAQTAQDTAAASQATANSSAAVAAASALLLAEAQADAADAAAAVVLAQQGLDDANALVVSTQLALDSANATLVSETAILDDLINNGAPQEEIDAQQAIVDAAQEAVTTAQTNFDNATAAVPGAEQALADAQDAQATADAAVVDAQATADADAAQAAADQAIANADADAAADAQGQADADAAAAQAALDAYNALLAADVPQATIDEAQALADSTAQDAVDAAAALAAAQAAYDTALAESGDAGQALLDAQAAFNDIQTEWGIEFQNGTISIPNIAPDEGLSAPFNSWMTLFGQFFDHGLDLVTKGGSGTVFIPLAPDDPLYIEGSPTNFMVLTRATNQPGEDGILGTADDIHEHTNTTTSWVDQNQTYTSHASHQVFLREYELNSEGKPVATGHLLDGAFGGPATWGETKAQAREMLGIDLTDADVHNVPLLATDEYGHFLRGPNGFALVVFPDGEGGFTLVEGNPEAPISLEGAVRTGHAFLDDIAHNAAPGTFFDHDGNPGTPMVEVQADDDDVPGTEIGIDGRGNKVAYDDELLDAHFVTGDGRGNENIGLTAVHHVFHSEHNRLVEHTKDVVIASGDLAFINEWLLEPITADQIPTTPEGIDALVWNGERLFQAAKFGTEMQYQHLVFEEFGRRVEPGIDLFVFNNITDIDPQIVAEFAHVVYRFGHSMLTESVDRTNIDGTTDNIGLIEAFLNPLEFANTELYANAEESAGAIVRGMTNQRGQEIDEFVTEALRNNLLGLPLDLATINITRARETGVPSLNEARAQFFEANPSDWIRPYTSWLDFAQNLKNVTSIVNFIAAYGTHDSVVNAITAEDKRDAAILLVLGGAGAPADRVQFLTGTGAWAGVETGLNDVDFWIGGLAEKTMPFGGMLGSTFTYVFEMQMENLQNNDRFYYLSRTQGLNFLTELENNAFSKIIMKNTNTGGEGPHLPGDIFSKMDFILEMNEQYQFIEDPVHDDPFMQLLLPKVRRVDSDNDGDWDLIEFEGGEHTVLGGTNEDDTIIADFGDDTVWGDGGNDWIYGGAGVNKLHGGDGDDFIFDGGDISFLHGEGGDDVLSGGKGVGDLLFGGTGSDFIMTGDDAKEAFGGAGNDFILGGSDMDFLLGNEGDDWIEAGDGFDTIAGDNSQLFFNSDIIGHDVMFGGPNEQDFDAESGDDIMVQGESVYRNEGMFGFDWVTHKDVRFAADVDLLRPIFTTDQEDILRDRYDQVEAASGWNFNDIIKGDNRTGTEVDIPGAPGANEQTMLNHELTQEGINRITGLRDIVGVADSGVGSEVVYAGGNILLGGGGSDTIEGRGGDDIIDGDAWLNVRLLVTPRAGQTWSAFSIDSLTQISARLLSGEIKTSQLSIVREILYSTTPGNNADVAVYNGQLSDYTITLDPDGAVRIVDNRAAVLGDDGVTIELNDALGIDTGLEGDRVRNVEFFRFSDGNGGTVDIAVNSLVNFAPQGAPTISDTTPTESVQLTADVSGITDQNGLPATLNIVWEVSFDGGTTWTQVGVGTNFTPTQGQVGGILRVVVGYTDNGGFTETLFSAPTGIVGDFFNGDGAANAFIGTEGDDLANGNGGADSLDGQGGDDVLNGGAAGDTLLGGAGNDTLDGGAGNDTMDGGAGNDSLLGGAGNDTLSDGVGLNTLAGGEGNDTYIVGAGDTVVEAAGEGTDTVRTALGSYTLGDNLENLVYTGAGTFNGTGNALNNAITGGNQANVLNGLNGADTLNGGGGDDQLFGGADNDSLIGADGNDLLDGGVGADAMNGGAGNDTFIVDNAGDTVNGGAGTDSVFTDLGIYTLANGVENLSYTGLGNFVGTGNGAANAIIGGAGDDVLDGAGGSDTLEGGNGADSINGGGGADIIIGGGGNDVLDGGTGNDTFVFSPGFGADTIIGFDHNPTGGQDLIDISDLGITDFATEVQIASVVGGVQITIGADTITLLGGGVNTTNITAADFILV